MLGVGTRFFGKDPAKDILRLKKFVDAASELAERVYVAVNVEEDKTDALEFLWNNYSHEKVDAFAVTPWGKFVPALNAIVYRAAIDKMEHLLLASAEFPPEKKAVSLLLREIDWETLVVGARFAEHDYRDGEVVEGTGTTVPWNTFALWNMAYLSRLGFPLAGDAPFDPAKAGVEEVTTIALYQELFNGEAFAQLIEIPGFGEQWNMEGWDEERRMKHEAKIKSKIDRPAAQLAQAHLKVPTVMHGSDSNDAGYQGYGR